jgi:hypothetical protein
MFTLKGVQTTNAYKCKHFRNTRDEETFGIFCKALSETPCITSQGHIEP